MKLGLVTKLDKINNTISKYFLNDVILINYDVIAIFPIYGQFPVIRKPDFEGIVCKAYIFIKSNLFSYKI